MTTNRTCPRCETSKPLDQFGIRGGRRPGRQTWCKACCAAATRDWYTRNAEQAKAARAARYEADPEPERARNRAWRTGNPRTVRDGYLRRKRGITIADYEAMLLRQNHRCAACGSTDTGDRRLDVFPVDHDHATGKVRGLLCSGCNKALGLLGDDPDRLMALAAYLLQHSNVLAEVAS